MDQLRAYFVTYNVGTSNPPDKSDELSKLLTAKDPKKEPDFYIISLQEVKAQPHNLLLDVFYDDPWTAALREVLAPKDYIKIKTIRLQGLVLNVFSLRKHLLNIREVETNYTRTGLSGMWGNKGAVSIRLGIYGCTICFVNSHLSAHDNQLKERVEDYNSIITDQEFHVEGHSKIFFHDYVFWMGDLNFRLLEEYEKTPQEIEKKIEKGDLDTLFAQDQLRSVMRSRQAFSELKESEDETSLPRFAPTFKYEVGTSKYDYKRKPAWTDRILYAVHSHNYENTKLDAKQVSYDSHPSYTLSDHKPVTSEFTIKILQVIHTCTDTNMTKRHAAGEQVFADYGEEVVKFEKIQQWWDDDENVVEYEFTKDHEVKDDWISVVKANFDCLDEYICYEYVKNSSPTPHPKNPENATKSKMRRFSITFPESANKNSGLFRLIYYSQSSHKVLSVLGVSAPFPIKSKQN